MCGEHSGTSKSTSTLNGSPPHVRGTPDYPSLAFPLERITPACAGNTQPVSYVYGKGEDHPRMCGEHLPRISCAQATCGSPPHVRGTQRHLTT